MPLRPAQPNRLSHTANRLVCAEEIQAEKISRRTCLAINFLALCALLLYAPLAQAQRKWAAVDPEIQFEIKNFGLTVDGRFDSLRTNLAFDPNNLGEAQLYGKVYTASIETGINKRDEHLRDEKYFDAANHPWLELNLLRVLGQTPNGYNGQFQLKMKGKSKTLEFPFRFSREGGRGMLTAEFEINRRDWDIGGGSISLSDDVRVMLRVPVRPLN